LGPEVNIHVALTKDIQNMATVREGDIDRLRREFHVLTEVSKTLNLPLELPKLLQTIMDKIISVFELAEVGAIMIWDQSSGLFRPAAAIGYNIEILKEIGLRAGEAITGKVYEEGRARLLSTQDEVAQAMKDIRPANRAVISRSLESNRLPRCSLAAPICVEDQKFGVLVLEILEGPQVFAEEDVSFIQILADLIALAIDRARLGVKADAIREVREADRMQSELMAMLSHELRMPLTAIKGYATALLMEDVDWSDEKRNAFLEMIEEECENMQVMLTDILDSSLIEVDQLTFKPQPVLLSHIAHDIAIEFQHRTEQHRLVIDFPPKFPCVEADPHWIKQVFRNILDNAIKYSPDGGLVVIKGEVRANDVVVSVSDQGIGISPEDLIPLFEKYFRVKTQAGINIPGTGLGLPIARVIIEAHGGRIWAESKLGQGTTMSYSLPRFEPSSGKGVKRDGYE
jgi:K+-sensing histidine kinase KdpD